MYSSGKESGVECAKAAASRSRKLARTIPGSPTHAGTAPTGTAPNERRSAEGAATSRATSQLSARLDRRLKSGRHRPFIGRSHARAADERKENGHGQADRRTGRCRRSCGRRWPRASRRASSPTSRRTTGSCSRRPPTGTRRISRATSGTGRGHGRVPPERQIDTSGSWEAGVHDAEPGIVMEANPQIPDAYGQEFLAGEADDQKGRRSRAPPGERLTVAVSPATQETVAGS